MPRPSTLVVGATGQLGARLVSQLAAAGERPRALVRSRERAATIGSFATPVFGDLLSPGTLTDAFRGTKRVFIVAPPVPEMQALERNAIDAAIAAGAERIVYLSNVTATVDSDLMPMRVHGLHERLIASLGIQWTVLGPTRYMTSLPFNWSSVFDDGLLLESSGAGRMTCIDPDEVAEVAVKALLEDGHDGKTYRLTSGDAFTAAELAELLSTFVGREVKVVDDAPRTGYFAMVAAGAYTTTQTAAELLGRAPRSYADWLALHAPVPSGLRA